MRLISIMCILSPETDNCLSKLNQRKEENERRKYFMIKSPQKNAADPVGVERAAS